MGKVPDQEVAAFSASQAVHQSFMSRQVADKAAARGFWCQEPLLTPAQLRLALISPAQSGITLGPDRVEVSAELCSLGASFEKSVRHWKFITPNS